MQKSRRVFMFAVAATGAAVAVGAHAQTKLDPKDAQAAALGYVIDASKTDVKKYATYKLGQICGNCALYQGKPKDELGNCPLFAGKQIATKGWCSAWVKQS